MLGWQSDPGALRREAARRRRTAELRLAGTRRRPKRKRSRPERSTPDRDLDPAAREAEATLAAARKAGILPARSDDDGDGDGDDAPEPRENPPRREKGPAEREADRLLEDGAPRTGKRS